MNLSNSFNNTPQNFNFTEYRNNNENIDDNDNKNNQNIPIFSNPFNHDIKDYPQTEQYKNQNKDNTNFTFNTLGDNYSNRYNQDSFAQNNHNFSNQENNQKNFQNFENTNKRFSYNNREPEYSQNNQNNYNKNNLYPNDFNNTTTTLNENNNNHKRKQ